MSTVIFGSKPDPILPNNPFEAVVYVNGSIYADEALSVSKKYHFVSDYILTDYAQHYTNTRQMCRNRRVHRLAVVKAVRPDLIKFSFEDINYQYDSVRYFSGIERHVLAQRFMGTFRYLWFVYQSAPPSERRRRLNEFFHKDLGGDYRPSSGVMALLWALEEGLGTPPYILCGIGCEPDGYAYDRTGTPRGHLQTDAVLLARLAQHPKYRGKIFSTDFTLSERTGIARLDGQSLPMEPSPSE